ncbi:MAG: hypothetical protein GY768_00775 [Planctomycetaceae bacterium]|nr:hypothetical protein [Planctomycetaceae bacterium]
MFTGSIRQTFRRLLLTIALLVIMCLAGIISGSYSEALSNAWYEKWGSSPAELQQGHWLELFSSMAFTTGGSSFYFSVIMLAICVGTAELQFGFTRTLTTFFGVHVVTLVVIATGITIAARLQISLGETLYYVMDVGPSAGYYGCLGLVIGSRKPTVRRLALIVIMGVLTARLAWSAFYLPENGRMLSADVAHAIAFPLGLFSARLTARSPHDPKPSTAPNS